MKQTARILFVSDSLSDYQKAVKELEVFFHSTIIRVEKLDDFKQELVSSDPEIIISEYNMPDFSGLDVLFVTRQHSAFLPVIIFTDSQTEGLAISGLQAGATDYVLKDRIRRLPFAVQSAIENADSHKRESITYEKLRISERRYRSYIEQAPDGIIILTADGNYLEANKTTEYQTGYSIQELKKLKIINIIDPEYRTTGLRLFKTIIDQGAAFAELRVIRKQGDKAWWSIKGVALEDGNIMGFIRDISSLKEAQQAIQDSETKYKMLVENNVVALFITNIKLQLEYMSPNIEQIVGYTPEERYAQNFWANLTPDSVQKLKDAYRKQLEIEESGTADPNRMLTIDFEEYHKNGQLLNIESTLQFIRDKNGIPIGFTGIYHDITERKKIQQQLARNFEETQAILRNAPVGIFVFDHQFTITSCNTYFGQLLGFTPEKIVGQHIQQLLNPSILPHMANALKGKAETWECKLGFLPDQQERTVQITAAPIQSEQQHITEGIVVISDISERIIAEQKIKETQEQFKRIFYFSPTAMGIRRWKEGSFVEVNDAWCRLTGYTRDSIRNKTILELQLIEPEQFAHINQKLEEQGYITEATMQLKCRTGELRIMLASFVLYELKKEKLVLFNFVDITEFLRQEEALLTLSNAIEQSPVSVIITNIEGVIEYANPRTFEVSGYSARDLIGHKALLFAANDTTLEHYRQLHTYILRGETWKGELLHKKKTGELFWESVLVSPIVDDSGYIKNYITVKEDITKQKEMEDALRDSEKRYRKIFMNNPVPMWIYETDSLRIIEANSKAIHDYGYTEEEFQNMTLIDLRPAADIPFLLEELKQHPTSDYSEKKEFRHQYKDGSVIQVEIDSFPISTSLGKDARMALAHNITERLKARQLLEEAKAKAEASDKLKTHFLNNISHEVRTPLNGILGATSLLNEPGLDMNEVPELMEIIELSTHRLINTITDYMDISLLASNNMEVNAKAVKLAEIVEKFRAKYNKECINKGLDFNIKYNEDLGNIHLELDIELIQKALNHLLDNALKYTNKGSITLGINQKNSKICFYVRDTGIGVNPENITAIFHYFRQEDEGSSRYYEGSGLGLAIVKGITELMGGELVIESEKNKGSTFHLCFPLKNLAISKSDSHLQQPDISKTNPIVLIAEDEESNFLVLSLIMRKNFNAKVLHAINGRVAVDMVAANPEIDLILMDLKMPVMDGFEATIEIKKIRPDIPIIAITAFAMSGDEHRALSVGCDYYLAKPINRHELWDTMKRLGFILK